MNGYEVATLRRGARGTAPAGVASKRKRARFQRIFYLFTFPCQWVLKCFVLLTIISQEEIF